MPQTPAQPAPPDPQDTGSSIKETIISLTISFVFAFVFRGFIVEAFVIPTGSMAPTLMGAHMRFTDPETGYVWPVGPWDLMQDHQTPLPLQGLTKNHGPVKVNDPMSGAAQGGNMGVTKVPAIAGDRIFVLKYLKGIIDPQRWDVIVFRSPGHPETNFIKRLIGLPGDQVAFVDGDLFVRKAPNGGEHPVVGPGEVVSTKDSWDQPGWQIQRKTAQAQKAVWQLVYDSYYTPLNSKNFKQPWQSSDAGWDFSGGATYAYKSEAATSLSWDSATWPILDIYPYNQTPNNLLYPGLTDLFDHKPDAPEMLAIARQGMPIYPVSDLKMSANVTPVKAGMDVSAVVSARGHEFRGRIEHGNRGVLEMRRQGDKEWKELTSGSLSNQLTPGMAHHIEFWHVDQSLSLYIDDGRELYAEYNWSPIERVTYATTIKAANVADPDPSGMPLLMNQAYYHRPAARFEFAGSPCQLSHVSMARDLHYQATMYSPINMDTGKQHTRYGLPAAATNPVSTVTLNSHEYFCCGDNSPASSDCRLWDYPDKWVMERVNPQFGVVDEKLVIGKAFIVYLPGLGKSKDMPMIDFGHMRWIW